MKRIIWVFAIFSVLLATALFLRYESHSVQSKFDPNDIENAPIFALEKQYPEPWVSCDSAVDWRDAPGFLGRVIYVKGPVAIIDHHSDIDGAPTYINLGASYPDRERFTLVIWGRNVEHFQPFLDEVQIGDMLCATGQVSEYQEISQIQMRSPGQVEFAEE